MKKQTTDKSNATQVNYTCEIGEVVGLSNHEVKKPSGWVPVRVEECSAYFKINGKTYEGTRTTTEDGGARSEAYKFFGQDFATEKDVAEHITNNIEK